MDVYRQKVAAINDARISQRHSTATQTPPDIHTETRGLLDSRDFIRQRADILSAKRLKDDGIVTPGL
jgi:hypothetical protein